MNICGRLKENIVDFIEGRVSEDKRVLFDDHLKQCSRCHEEYVSIKKLYEVLDADEVVLPERQFFDNLRLKMRQREIVPRWFTVKRFLRIFVPACVAAVLLVILIPRPTETIEIAIPTSTLLEDEEIADISLEGVISDELIDDMTVLEDYFTLGVDESINELTEEEQATFVQFVSTQYDYGW